MGFLLRKGTQRTRGQAGQIGYGDTWTWVAIDADTKLVPTWAIGSRDAGAAFDFILDLKEPLANRVQLTTDGHKAYLSAIEDAFGRDIDYAMLVKLYGPAPEGERRYSLAECVGVDKRIVQGNLDESALVSLPALGAVSSLPRPNSRSGSDSGQQTKSWRSWAEYHRSGTRLERSRPRTAGFLLETGQGRMFST
jgi:hypothetical protein